jgi:tRNA(Arg) A34 adenosine deaminase TadA
MAGRQARTGGTRYIFTRAGLASCRRRPPCRHMGTLVSREWLPNSRRSFVAGAAALAAGALHSPCRTQAVRPEPELRWYEAAVEMRRLAESWGDQPYGAVLVMDGAIVGLGPSRVLKKQNQDAHAEREAVRDAQVKLGRQRLAGAALYSTSRPCSLCEAAAAQAGVARMYFGPSLTDAGVPGQAR